MGGRSGDGGGGGGGGGGDDGDIDIDGEGAFPSFPKVGRRQAAPKTCRVTLRAPPWSAVGWTADSPGFCFWFRPYLRQGPRMFHGENIIRSLLSGEASGSAGGEPCHAVRAHHFAHRYAVLGEKK